MKAGAHEPLIDGGGLGDDGEPLIDGGGLGDDGVTEPELRTLFLLLSLCVGVNHGAVTTPIAYASTVLATDVGEFANSFLFAITILSSLFLAPLATSRLGPKKGLILGMAAYTAYVWCFASAILACRVRVLSTAQCREGGPAQWAWAGFGSLLGGLGAGLLWPCQGALFAGLAREMAVAKERRLLAGASPTEPDGPRQDLARQVTSEMASTFAVYFLSLEFTEKTLFTVLQQYVGLPAFAAFQIFGGMALVSTVVFASYFRVHALVSMQRQISYSLLSRDLEHVQKRSVRQEFLALLRLWKDPKLSLLMFTNLAFGFSSAWLNGYINATFLGNVVGIKNFIGFLGALVAVIAAVSSKVYGLVAARHGKLPVILFGSVCFFCVGALSQVNMPGGWGMGILVFYVLQGLGRGVYESTNKGMFADFFPDEKAPPAFANVMVQSSLAAAASFTFLGMGAVKPTLYILLTSAVFTFPCTYCAGILLKREQSMTEPRTEML